MIRSDHRRPIWFLCVIAFFSLATAPACIKTPAPEPVATQGTPDPNARIDEILQRYQEAVGGQEAVERVFSYQGKGTFSTSISIVKGTYEVWGKDPDKTLSIITFAPSVSIVKGCDGTSRWVKTPAITYVDDSPDQMAEVERDAEIYRAGKIKNLFKTMRMEPNARLHGREVYVIEGKPEKGPSDKLFFDVKDGLLLRWDMVRRNPKTGNVFVKVHLDDYRNINGVKVPFKVRFSFESFYLTLIMDELKHNVEIDDRFFMKPGS